MNGSGILGKAFKRGGAWSVLVAAAMLVFLPGCEIIGRLTDIAYGERPSQAILESRGPGCALLTCGGNPRCQLIQENGGFERSVFGLIPDKWYGDHIDSAIQDAEFRCSGENAMLLNFPLTVGNLEPGDKLQQVQCYSVGTASDHASSECLAYPEWSGGDPIRVRAVANFNTTNRANEDILGARVWLHIAAYRGNPFPLTTPDPGGTTCGRPNRGCGIDPETYPNENLLEVMTTSQFIEVFTRPDWTPVKIERMLPEGTDFLLLLLETEAPFEDVRVWVDDVRVAFDNGNVAPYVADDFVTGFMEVPITVSPLSNDRDPDGQIDPETFTIVDQPDMGEITDVGPSNTGLIAVTYLPGRFVGRDRFRYIVADNDGAVSDTATVTLTIQTGADTYNLNVAKTALIDRDPFDLIVPGLIAAGDTLTYSVSIHNQGPGPARGVVVEDRLPTTLTTETATFFATPPTVSQGNYVFDSTARVLTWTLAALNPGEQEILGMTLIPDEAASGGPYASTTAIVEGLAGDTNPDDNADTAAVSVNIRPVTMADSAVTTVNTPVSVEVLANDMDPDGFIRVDGIFLRSQISESLVGVVSVPIPADGTVTYTPTQGYTGPDLFEYRVRDNLGTASPWDSVFVVVQ